MKYVVFVVGALLMFGGSASAQEEAGTTSEPEAAAEPAPAEAPPQEEEKKKSPYNKKVEGWLWLEGFAGPSAYDPDSFGTLGGAPNAPRLKGPEYGFAVGTPFGGGFFLGWFYRQADYSAYKLMKTGLDMQANIRIPYVHVIFRASIGFAKTFSGNPYDLTDTKNGGVSFTGGLGLRIPIVRWISFATTFDWTYVGLAMQGDTPTGGRVDSWISGQQFGATFALTFQFIGVR